MTDKTEYRIREMQFRIQKKRRKMENRMLSMLTMFCLFFIVGIYQILQNVKMPGLSTIAGCYGTVLLREGTSAYVVTAVAAFVFGVIFTVICIKSKNKTNMDQNEEDKEKKTGS